MARVNRAVELLAQGQPVYYTGVEDVSYQGGVKSAQTWADYLLVEMEHGTFDLVALEAFMKGLVDGGPTRSGHRTPAVVVTLPTDGTDAMVMRANAWMVKQVLARGVHGILLCHAESPEAVRVFVESCRYPFQTEGVGEQMAVGRRGSGGQGWASTVWGLSSEDYLQKADPWPLNPEGELLLGLKVENRRALANVEASVSVPGIAFAEWGPGDMSMSFGHVFHHDPPYPPELESARARVLNACKAAGVAFLNMARPQEVIAMIEEGVRVCGGPEESAEIGRRHTGRTLP